MAGKPTLQDRFLLDIECTNGKKEKVYPYLVSKRGGQDADVFDVSLSGKSDEFEGVTLDRLIELFADGAFETRGEIRMKPRSGGKGGGFAPRKGSISEAFRALVAQVPNHRASAGRRKGTLRSEQEFTARMLKIYEDAKSQIGYQSNRFRQKVVRDGGIAAAKYWLRPSANTTEGFSRLLDHDRLDLSVEAVVLEPEWRNLFTAAELTAARSRLEEVGYFTRIPLPKARAVDFGADEIDPSITFPEGLKRSIQVNAYERDPRARQLCIGRYGVACYVCGFDFAAVYGELGAGYIHVHHLLQLATVNGQVRTDAIRDLRPVCPNCHSMLHRQSPPLAIGELRRRMKEKRRQRK